MKKILLDTNFLLIPYQFKVDIFSEIDRIILEKYQICILDKTIDELNKIIRDKEQKLKNRLAATLALQLVKAKDVKIIKTKLSNKSEKGFEVQKELQRQDKSVDDIIAELKGYIIATQDILLRKRLKHLKKGIITLRQKKYLIYKTESF